MLLFNYLTLITLTLVSHTWAQADLPNEGCSTMISLAQSCVPRATIVRPFSVFACACYDSHSSYVPNIWDSAVDACYTYMADNRASLATEDIYSINGGLAFPESFSAELGGLCTKHASAPATNVASTSTSIPASTSQTGALASVISTLNTSKPTSSGSKAAAPTETPSSASMTIPLGGTVLLLSLVVALAI